MALLPLCAAFSKASGSQQVAATGLASVTVTLKQVKLSDNSLTTLVSGGSAFEVGGGVYGYTYSGTLDFTTYYYAAAFHTADATVQAQDVAAAYFDFPLSLAKDAAGRVDVGKVAGTAQTARDLGANLDAAVSGRAAPGDAMTLTAGERAAVADKALGRNLAGGSDGGRTVKDALRASRNKVAFDVPGVGQFTVFAEDDTTPAWVGTYQTAAGNPVTSIDPA